MKIAQLAPLYESVPPKLYGGTERIVSYLTEELVRTGHDVTLFASGDSLTRAKLEPLCERSLRLENSRCRDSIAYHILACEQVCQRSREFDIIHSHVDYLFFPFIRRCEAPVVTTLHGRLDLPELQAIYREFREISVISISNAQRNPLPNAHWEGTVYHGMPAGPPAPGKGKGGYLAFLGRVSPEKRLDRAIEIAKHAGLPLKIAAKIDPVDREYFKTIEALLDHPLVEYLGEIGEKDKHRFLGDALALLFPIDWPEPFGIVMMEAMACGAPVIAFREGSVPEIVEEGVTGFICHDVLSAARAVKSLPSFDRSACRQAFEKRFTDERMTRDYLHIYERMIRESAESPQARVSVSHG